MRILEKQHPDVDVYPVGVLAELCHAWRYLAARKFSAAVGPPTWSWRISRAGASLQHIRQAVVRHVRAGNWRALKNTFNGHLAEPLDLASAHAQGWNGRCGTGWTRAGAMRSLCRRGWRG